MKKKKTLLLRNLIKFNENIQTKKKILNFKKKKWELLKTKILNDDKKNKEIFKKNNQSTFILNKKLLFDQTIFHTPTFYTKINKNSVKMGLKTKKQLEFFYGGLSKNYLKNLRKKSIKKTKLNKSSKRPSEYMLEILESRLDFILYKAGFGFTVIETINLIQHGHVFVNNKIIKNPRYLIKKGDSIKIKKKNHFYNKIYQTKPDINNILTPNYLHVNYKTLEIIVIKEILMSNTIQNFKCFLNLANISK